jgi:hypothetical protein
MKLWVALLIPILMLAACAKVDIEPPEGFAESRTPLFRSAETAAVSPEGINYRVRVVKNYPRKSLSFWKDTLTNQLEEEGYGLLNQGEFETPHGSGTWVEWVVPYRGSAYLYLTAFTLVRGKILVAECGGEYSLYTRYREDIQESLSSMQLRARLF